MVALNRIAIIPARGGSKRLPGKNIADFHGRPMIDWTISAAVESQMFDRVMVSTDNEEIAMAARKCGLEVPFLRDAAADDHTPVSGATLRALEQSVAHYEETYQTVCQLMPNCPLRTAKDIVEACNAFDESGAEFQLSAFRFGWMNPWWAARRDERGRPVRLFPEIINTRSQDLAPLYCPTGAIWLATVEPFKQAGTFLGPDHRFEPIDWKSALDIDDAEDMEMAAAVASLAGIR